MRAKTSAGHRCFDIEKVEKLESGRWVLATGPDGRPMKPVVRLEQLAFVVYKVRHPRQPWLVNDSANCGIADRNLH